MMRFPNEYRMRVNASLLNVGESAQLFAEAAASKNATVDAMSWMAPEIVKILPPSDISVSLQLLAKSLSL
jgi:hypothetical protein